MATAIVTTSAAESGRNPRRPSCLTCNPDEVAFLLVVRQLSTCDMERLARLMRAQVAGRLEYTPDQIKAWTVADFRAAADDVPVVHATQVGGCAHG